MPQIHIVTEDILSEVALQKIIAVSNKELQIASSRICSGFGQIKKNLSAYNSAAQVTPWIVLTDLDNGTCAPTLIANWFSGIHRHQRCVFRVAVREIESWLMADRAAFARHLRIQINRVPAYPENEVDPKKLIIELAKSSPSIEPRISR